MADDVNANIRIDLDTSDAVASLKTLQAQISAFNQSVIKSNATAVAAQKSMLSTLTAQIGATQQFTTSMVNVESSVSRLGRSIDKNKLSLGEYFRYGVASSKNFGRVFGREHTAIMELAADRVKRLQTQYIALGEAQNGMTRAMAVRPMNLFNADAAIAVQRQQLFNRLLSDGSTSLINFGKNTQWAGRQLMVGFTVPLTIFGGIAGKIFMDLERQVVNFRRVYGDATTPLEETNGMVVQVQELAKEFTKYGISVRDTVALAADAAAAGAQSEDLLAATAQATRLSTLGMIDQQQALTATIALQSAFRLNTEELANSVNFLNAVENQTVVSLADITEAIPKVAPVIQGLGGDVEDLAVFMAALREGGVSAAEGANALKSGLASLINPTKNAREQLEKVGINIDAILAANKGDIQGTVRAFGEALMTLDKFERQQTLAKVFGKYQFARLGALFENIARDGSQAQRVVDLTAMSIEELGALAEKELGAIEESVGVKFTAAVEKFKLAIAPIGEVFLRVATPIIDFATKLLEKFNELGPGVKNFIAIMVAGLGVVVPTVIMLIGLFANFAGNAVKGLALVNNLFNRIRGGAGTFEYLSSEQLDAAAAAASLEGQTNSLTSALNIQRSAVNQLARAYGTYTAAAQSSAANLPQGFRRPLRGMATGGLVGGTGNKDSEPTLLTPGEFVMNRDATQKFGPILDAMNRGSISQLAEGSRLTQRTHLTGAISVTATEAMLERVTNSTRQMLSVIQKVEQVLGRSISNISKVSNLIVEMPSEFNQAMKSGIGQGQFATQFGATGVEKFKTTAAIAKQDFETLRPHLEILDREIINASKDFAVVSDMNIDEITKKAFSRLPAESRKMLSEIEALSTQYNNLRVSVQDLNRITNEERQRLEAAGISFRTGADPNRQYITAPGMGTASTRTRQETRSAGPTYRRSPLFLSPDVVQESRKLAVVASKAAGDAMIKEMTKASRRAGQVIAPNIMLGANAASPPPWSIQLGGWIGDGIEKGMTTSLADINARLRTQMMTPQGGFLLPAGPTSPLPAGDMANVGNQANEAAGAMSKIKGAASKFGSTLMRGSAKMQGAFFALDGLVFAASMMNNSMGEFAQKILPAVFAIQGLTMVLPLLTNPVGLAVVATGALIAGIWALNKQQEEARKKTIEYAIAIQGSSKAFNEFAQAFGGQKPSEIFAQMVGGATTEKQQETFTKAQEFVKSEAGQGMMQRSQMLSGQERVNAIVTELTQSIGLGIIDSEMANGIAQAIAAELKSPMLGFALTSGISDYVRSTRGQTSSIIKNLTESISQDLDNVLVQYEQTFSQEQRLRSLAIKEAEGTINTQEYQELIDLTYEAQRAQDQWQNSSVSARQAIGPLLNISQKLAEAQALINIKYREGSLTTEEYRKQVSLLEEQNQRVADSFNQLLKDLPDYEAFIGSLETAALALGIPQDRVDQVKTQVESIQQVLTEQYGIAEDQAQNAGKAIAAALMSGTLDPGIAGSLTTLLADKQWNQIINVALAGDAAKIPQILTMINTLEQLPEPYKTDILVELGIQGQGKQDPEKIISTLLPQLDKLSVYASYFANNPILGAQAFSGLKGGVFTTEQVNNAEKLFNQLNSSEQVSSVFDFSNVDLDSLVKVNKQWSELGKKKNIRAIIEVDDNFSQVMDEFKVSYAQINNLPDIVKQAILLKLEVQAQLDLQVNQALNADMISGGQIGGAALAQSAGLDQIRALLQKIQDGTTGFDNEKGGGDKTKSWLEQLLADIKANLALFVGNLEKGVKPIVARLRKLGISEQIIEAIGTGEEGRKRAQEILGMTKKQRNIFIERQNRATVGEFITGPGGLETQNIQKQNEDAVRKRLQDRGIEKSIIDKILNDEKAVNAVLVANNDEVTTIVNHYKGLQTSQEIIDAKVKEIKDKHAETEKILNSQISQQETIIGAIQDQIDGLEKKNEQDQWAIRGKEREKELIDRQIEALERANEMDERRIGALQRQDELRNREADALSHELDQLSQIEEQIRKTYQDRIDALDKVAEINSFIVNQQKQQLGLSQALSQGDIYAATAAAQDMRASQAEFAQQQMRVGLQQGMEGAVAGLRTAGGLTRDQAEKQIAAIKEQSYQTSLQIRDIEDQIFIRNQQIVPLKDQQYKIDQEIQVIADTIYARETDIYNIRTKQLEPQQKILEGLNKEKTDLQSITDETINQIEALGAQVLGLDEVTGRVNTLAEAWHEVGKQINDANKLANSRLAQLGKAPEPKKGQSSEAFAKELQRWQDERARIEKDRAAKATAALESGKSAMDKKFAGGMVNYKGSTEPPPAQMMGGGKVMRYGMGKKVMGYAAGNIVGTGSRDSVPAMLTPGEFVVRKAMVDKYGTPLLQAINQGAFGMPRFNTAQAEGSVSVKSQAPSNIVAPMYNNYSVNVSVSGTNASADEIANKTIMKIKQMQDMQIRSGRGY